MATPKETIWELEPHSEVKHKILQGYLKAWFPIVSSISDSINYIDGFAGPRNLFKGRTWFTNYCFKPANEHTASLNGIITFLFIEEVEERAKNLQSEINKIELKENLKPFVIQGKYHEVIESELKSLEIEGKILGPTFAFIDPFGFSGIPADSIGKLLSIPKVEVFINFSVDSINRFIGTEDADFHINELFGTPKISEIIKNYSKDRVRDLRDSYQLMLNTLAAYVRYFEMRNEDNRPIYYLFFATNNRVGHLKMKEAMWRVDKEGDFKFSDATNPDQIVLFEKVEFGEEVFKLVKENFHTGTFDVQIIRLFIEDKTPFLKKHLGQALNFAEQNGLIEVENNKADGSKRKKGTFPDGTILLFK